MPGRQQPKSPPTIPPGSATPKPVRAGATFRLIVSFMLLVIMAFVAVEGWRIWRDYRSALNIEHTGHPLSKVTASAGITTGHPATTPR
ncbi:MAG: hypothetical protein M3Q94_06015 [Pseudomonadota bacterium]|nr:hypothetical protein [Pseudomonadota bacterium]